MNQVWFENVGFETGGRTMACGEQPQARLETFGVHALSDTELLAVLLQGGAMRPVEAVGTASQLLAAAGSMAGLAAWQPADYRRLRGIGRSKGLQLAAMGEIARRMMRPVVEQPLFGTVEAIADHFRPIAMGLEVEKFWVCCLNRKNRLIRRVELTSGTATATLAHPREVFRAAIREGATAIVCVHNHPSGDPTPSTADVQATKQLREASRLVDVALIDHVIIGRPAADPTGRGYFSFRSAGLI